MCCIAMPSNETATAKMKKLRGNMRAYKEILAACEELRSVCESDPGSGKRLWQLLNLVRVDVDRIIKASEAFIGSQ